MEAWSRQHACNALASSQASPGATSHLQKLPCPEMPLHTMETAAFCKMLEGQKGGNFTLHSLHLLCSYLPFQGHLSSVTGLPLVCTILLPEKAPNHFKRQENWDATRLQKGVLDINHLPATGIQRIEAVGVKNWEFGCTNWVHWGCGQPGSNACYTGATKATENTATSRANFGLIVRATALICHREDRRD